ncbi:hypothetical protein EV148_11110 [Dokdonella fugitiva]|uniref:Uncharacterized protein n=1 Tax=Dokdonella fugitiva TaxID=328517 RepID=A0A4R2HZ14_9GAMM|nr:hypothetical protein EV148_11110 [Dokdonella fugitiva]
MHEDDTTSNGAKRRTCGEGAPSLDAAAVPAGKPVARTPAPLDVRCLACGSADLDMSVHPRGDEPVQCRQCGEWNTYLRLEIAAVERVRQRLRRR